MTSSLPILPGLKLNAKIRERQEAVVYRGSTNDSPHPVVVKVYSDWGASKRRVEAVERAFAISSTTSVGPLVRSLRMFDSGYQRVVVMEDCGGKALRRLLTGRPQPVERVLGWAIAICEALQALHDQHIYHGLPSPDHVLVHPRTRHVHLIGLDYGAAPTQVLSRPPPVAREDAPYAAPELAGQIGSQVDHRTDLYTLGVSLYEALVGEHPFTEMNPLAAAHARVVKPAGILRRARPGLPPVVCEMVERLMEVSPDDRYQSVVAFRSDAQRCLRQLQEAQECPAFELGTYDTLISLVSPDKLYGRFQEQAELRASFAHCKAGKSSLLVISGPPGIGKTRLVGSLRSTFERQGAVFVTGKVDQFTRGRPFGPLADTLLGLVEYILSQEEAVFQRYRDELIAAVGLHARALVDFLPDLGLILGEQHGHAEVSSDQAQRRLRLALPSLIRALASAERPLVFFLDDLQWADASTMGAIELLISPGMAGVFVIIAYRDEEVSADHALAQMLNGLEERGLICERLHLRGLSEEGLKQWVADGLHCPTTERSRLASLLGARGASNPFVMGQLLLKIQEDRVTHADDGVELEWNDELVTGLPYTDDVVELIAGRVRQLPEDVQYVLAVAACIGRRFDTECVARASSISSPDVVRLIAEAERFGLVSSEFGGTVDGRESRERGYRFRHDRLQEAAKRFLSADRELSVRWEIGRVLKARGEHHAEPQAVFRLVEQLNPACALATTERQRAELIELNMLAGRTAQRAAATTDAVRYYTIAVELMGTEAWRTRHEDLFEVKYQLAECEYVLGHFERSHRLHLELERNTSSPYASARVDYSMLNALSNEGEYAAAIEAGLKGLAHLGRKVPSSPQELSTLTQEVAASVQRKLEAIDYRPDCLSEGESDEALLLEFDILRALIPSTFVGGRIDLFALVAATGAELALTGGSSSRVGPALASYAALLVGAFGNYPAAFRVGEMALAFCERYRDEASVGGAIHWVGTFALHWGRPAREAWPLFEHALTLCLRSGDFIGTAHCAVTYAFEYTFAGDSLKDCAQMLDEYLSLCGRIQETGVISSLVEARAVVGTLQGREYTAQDAVLPFVEDVDDDDAASSANMMAYCMTIRLLQQCVLGEYAEATVTASRGAKYMDSINGIYLWTCFYFFRPLALACQLQDLDESEKSGALETIAEDQEKLDAWEQTCSANYHHLAALLRGATMAGNGDALGALQWFDRAIVAARGEGVVLYEALACELAGRACADLGLRHAEAHYVSLAHRVFQNWGAHAKAEQLAAKYDDLLGEQLGLGRGQPGVSRADGGGIERHAIVKAAQAIASELDPGQLNGVLMQTLLECSGATRAVLVEREGDGWRILVDYTGRRNGAGVERAGTSVESRVPVGVLNHAHRSDAPVVIETARINQLADSGYRQEFRPRSVMCLPVRWSSRDNGSLVYLESDRAHDIFDEEQSENIEIILAQASISMANADLHETMRREMAEKSLAKKGLEKLLAEKEALLREVHHRVRNNLQVVESILGMQARSGGSEGRATLRRARERVAALSLVHGQLYGNPDLAEVDLLEFVEGLCARLPDSVGEPAGGPTIVVRGLGGLPLDTAASVPCGLIISEAFSNAAQHAFAPGKAGRVLVTVGRDAGDLTVEIRDDGVGLPADYSLTNASTLGAKLMVALARQLGGTIDARNDGGAVVSYRFPRTRRATPSSR